MPVREMTREELMEENAKLREEAACLRAKAEELEKRNILFDFQQAVMPAIEWFHDNCNPHQKIIIDSCGAELVSGEIGIPVGVVE